MNNPNPDITPVTQGMASLICLMLHRLGGEVRFTPEELYSTLGQAKDFPVHYDGTHFTIRMHVKE